MRQAKTKAILFSFCLLFLFAACEKKENGFDPEETVVTIDATNWTGSSGDDVYVVVENKTSTAKYILVEEGNKIVIKRGSEISGDLVNLHFIYVCSIDDRCWEIHSYQDLQLGKEVPLLDRNIIDGSDKESQPGKGIANITFSDIPAFDIATRNAKIPQHAHTLGTLEVPCAAAGGNTYPTGSNFYVSLINEGVAAYKLISVPLSTDFDIPLSELNYSMTNYSIPKDASDQPNISVTASGSEGGIEIFSLNSAHASLFTGNNIEIYVPDGIPQMQLFSTSFNKSKVNGASFSLYINQTNIPNNYSFLDLSLGLVWSAGSMPALTSTTDEYDYILMNIIYEDEFYLNNWLIISPDCNKILKPELPPEVIMAISDNSTFSKILENPFAIDASAVEDSRLGNYDEVLEYLMQVKDQPIEPYTLFKRKCLVKSI